MYDHQMNRITSQVAFGRDYSDLPTPEMDQCPTGTTTDTGPTFSFLAPSRRRRWFR